MVIILNHYPSSLDTLSFRPPSSSSNFLNRSTPSPTTTTVTTTETLAAAHTSQWDRLPFQREPVAPRPPPTPLRRTTDNANRKQSMNERSPLEIDTSMFAAIDYSSASSMSASTMASERASSSDTDGDDAINEPGSGVVPKTEDGEETYIEEIRRVESSESPDIKAEGPKRDAANPKKRRGRPRKNPPTCATTVTKVAKGRSKTGCLTCRRRKKKCDEAKPSCNNCQKNAVVCEGYPSKGVWRSGKQRSEEVVMRKFSFTIPRGLPFLVDGIETDIDRRFLNHFVYELSQVLTLHDNTSNPFKDILLPMATQHKGLMHSLMALSGSHIIQTEPKDELNERQQHHSDIAVTILLADITKANQGDRDEDGTLIVEDPTIASTIVQCLLCISEGLTNGEYRAPLEAARLLITDRKSKNPEFQQFIWEFFTYHDVSNSMTSLARQPVRNNSADDQYLPDFVFQNATQPRVGVLVGVLDGLYKYLKRITALRDNIRARKDAGLQPVVLYEYLSQAVDIDAAIHNWESNQEPQTPRWIAAELFRQCTWVYLYRTIQASKPNPNLCSAVDSALDYLRLLPPQESTTCLLLLPLFILGCAAFEPRQRPDLEDGFDNLQAYSNLGNIKPARQIVRRVWEMMDVGDERSWDWETIMADMGIDLLVT